MPKTHNNGSLHGPKEVVALNHSQNKYKYKDAYKHKEKREYMVK